MAAQASIGRISDSLGPVSAPYIERLDNVTIRGVWLGPGVVQFEVCELICELEPSAATMRSAWRKRRGSRGRPLIIFWQGHEEVLVTEPTGEPQVTVLSVSVTVALTVIRRALAAPRGEAVATALALLERAQGSGGVAGFRNRNLLSTHFVTGGFQRYEPAVWAGLQNEGLRLRTEPGARLLRALGYNPVASVGFEVIHGGKPRIYSMALPDGTPLDKSAAGPGGSPTTRLLVEANARGAERAVIVSGRLLRIYVADPAKGLDDVATASNYIELDLEILSDEMAGLLPLLFSAKAHAIDGLFDQLMRESNRYAVGLRDRFRERVYSDVVGELARALYAARGNQQISPDLLYQATLRMLYRLLFVLYAEDRNLLPLGNSEYRRVSLTQTLFRLEDRRGANLPFDRKQTTLWDDLFRVFESIRSGNIEWNVPGYNGGLFEPELEDYPEAAFLQEVRVANATLAPILLRLGFDEQSGHRGKIDFGDLGVRHLGSLYEGLLSFNLRVADEPLSVNAEGLYVPTTGGETPSVALGDVYVTSPKGGRKASGSHYTPTFIVRQLLDTALEPVLERHLAKVAQEPPEAQWKAMLAFHVIDPAMGSGHFLVDALDVISNRFALFLLDNPRIDARPIKAAREQITTIGKTYGIESLGETIGDFDLLRRIVMRNCIYGVDLNPMAVELAKLSLWLHAFVPGLPLSFLGHNLRHGNALVGVVGYEIANKLGDGLFGNAVAAALGTALEHANSLAALSDLSLDEIKKSEEAQEALEAVTVPLTNAFDAYSCRVYARNDSLESRPLRAMGRASLEFEDGLVRILDGTLNGEALSQIDKAQKVARALSAFHWQLAFPEVFLRSGPGFNVILGNPPWDKARFEAQQFWVSRVPGLNALPAGERETQIENIRIARPLDVADEQREREWREFLQDVILSEYRIQGRVGHVELAKAFTERVLAIKAEDGAVGYVLPGNALIIGGWGKIREVLSQLEISIIEARNTGGWMFADAEPRMSVILLSAMKPQHAGRVSIVPEISSVRDLEKSSRQPATVLNANEIASLSDSYIVPWLNSNEEVSVLNKMRRRPSLQSGAGWIRGNHEAKWDFRSTGPDHRLAKGATANNDAWKILMTRHLGQYQLNYEVPFQQEVRDIVELARTGKNIVLDKGLAVLAASHSRIVVRHPSRSDDSRTMIASFLPDVGYLPCKGYVHSVQTQGAALNHVLALLGYLNSLSCDWWARRFVDRHITAPVINALPLPDWSTVEIDAVSSDVRAALSIDPMLAQSLSLQIKTASARDEARLRIEIAVASGFGFTEKDVATVLADFSDTEKVAPAHVRRGLRSLDASDLERAL